MRFQVIGIQRGKMFERTRSFGNTVRTVRVRHVLELLSLFDQFIHQQFGIAEVHVVVTRTVDVQEVAL